MREKKKANEKEAKPSNYGGLKDFTFVRVTNASSRSAAAHSDVSRTRAVRGKRHVSVRRLLRKRKNAAHLEEIRGSDSVVQVNEMVKYHRAAVKKKHRIRFVSP